jgi:hypothetical protein
VPLVRHCWFLLSCLIDNRLHLSSCLGLVMVDLDNSETSKAFSGCGEQSHKIADWHQHRMDGVKTER